MSKKPKSIAKPREADIHLALCNYVRLQYPDAIFTSESSGIRLTMGQAVRAKKLRSGSGLPDFWLMEPRGPYHGLFIELKRSREELMKANGELRDTPHIQEQNAMLERLWAKGYLADFACGLNQAICLVDNYMNTKPN